MRLVDEAIIFSILRGIYSAPEVNWDIPVKEWVESVSKKPNVKLLR